MGEFFGSIYCWFEEFFGLDLANYLWGGNRLRNKRQTCLLVLDLQCFWCHLR